MKIVITNTVALNGGDYAILHALINVLKNTYGENIQFIVYDSDSTVAKKFYPDINFRELIYNKLDRKTSNKYLRRLYFRGFLWLAKQAPSTKRFLKSFLGQDLNEDFNIYESADLIVSTGGTYLVENYSLEPRFFDFDFTLALKKRLVFFTQSLGPFNKPYNQRKIKEIFDKANLILLRDQASLNNLKQIEVNVARARVCADVVFAEADTERLNAGMQKQFSKNLAVGISVREWKYFKNRSNEEGMEKYTKSIAAICEYIVGELGGSVMFLSTCQGIKEYRYDDSKTAEYIYSLLSQKTKEQTTVNKNFHDPDTLKSAIESLDLVISTRMHFAIQSLSSGIPVLPIAYEFKTKELFSKLIDEDYILDIDNIEVDTTLKCFKSFLQLSPEKRAELFQKVRHERQSALKAIEYLKY